MADDSQQLATFLSQLKALNEARDKNKINEYNPYPKQKEFHDMGAHKTERLLSAGNQLGKTYAGAMEAAYHATGLYPHWWKGRRFKKANRGWVGGESAPVVRDTSQKLLLGDLTAGQDQLGTGAIPADMVGTVTWSRGVAQGVDTVTVKHKTGGTSIIKFKSYEQQRQKWQGDTIDWVWFDEEPTMELYSEGVARYTATGGMAWMTFTPLKGMSTVVRRFKQESNDSRGEVIMTAHDALHITEPMLKDMLSKYPDHEHETRINGVPMQGEGRIYVENEKNITVPPFDIPDYWPRIIGADFGYGDHPTAGAWLAHDRDNDIVYLYRSYRKRKTSIADNAEAFRAGGRIPIAWPQDLKRSANDVVSANLTMKDQYANSYCLMLPGPVRNKDGSVSVWAGVVDIQQRMVAGRFKVFSSQHEFFEEYRNYHMKDGKIVKEMDDLLDAVRYGMMGLQYARVIDENWYPGRQKSMLTINRNTKPFDPLEF